MHCHLYSSSTRMAIPVHVFKAFQRGARIDLRGFHRSVAQKLLNDKDISASLQEMGGTGVADQVRRDLFANL